MFTMSTRFKLIVLLLTVLALPSNGFAATFPKIDFIMVYKAARQLHLVHDGRIVKSYQIALGRQPVGHKKWEGDGKTPEGLYTLGKINVNSRFYKAIPVSYPNKDDKDYAATLGVSPGGAIVIHGQPNGRTAKDTNHPYQDWTQGCLALNNQEIDEIITAVKEGMEILILP